MTRGIALLLLAGGCCYHETDRRADCVSAHEDELSQRIRTTPFHPTFTVNASYESLTCSLAPVDEVPSRTEGRPVDLGGYWAVNASEFTLRCWRTR
jgi:hypothetical protein